jgi:hypothetical protein
MASAGASRVRDDAAQPKGGRGAQPVDKFDPCPWSGPVVNSVRYTPPDAHLAEVYGAEVSKDRITAITNRVMEGMAEWQNRPLDPVHPVLFIDCIPVKICDGRSPTGLSTSP